MLWTVPFLLSALLLCAIPLKAAAGDRPAETSCKVLEKLIEFVAEDWGNAETLVCPSVIAVNSNLLRASIHFADKHNRNEPMAVYDPTENSILVGIDLDLESAIGKSFLVHELVHAFQFQIGTVANSPCLGALEAEAYNAQADFLEREGFPKPALSYRFYALLMASCAQAYHPDF